MLGSGEAPEKSWCAASAVTNGLRVLQFYYDAT
jgi:hypothetical protein